MTFHNQNRVISIDILRALTMTLMVFVNDLWTLKDIPLWLEHTAAMDDGMGLADTIFPSFLFLVGMSIPLAVGHRRSKGDSDIKIIGHILLRSLALIVMGLFLVNGEYLNTSATGISRFAWNCICCTCFILLWNVWPASVNKTLVTVLKIIAFAVLGYLARICRTGEEGNAFSTFWWGILGLIGWAYLVSAMVYVFLGKRIWKMLLVWIFFMVLCIASHAGWLSSFPNLQTIFSPLGEGAMPAFVIGGAIITTLFIDLRKQDQNRKVFIVMILIAISLLVAGFYCRSFWGISKIRATPAWVLICSAIAILVFLFIYWSAEIHCRAKWFDVIKPAGTNTLLCYLLPYFIYALVFSIGLSLPGWLLTGVIGLIKSLIFAFLIVVVTGLLGRVGIKLKL